MTPFHFAVIAVSLLWLPQQVGAEDINQCDTLMLSWKEFGYTPPFSIWAHVQPVPGSAPRTVLIKQGISDSEMGWPVSYTVGTSFTVFLRDAKGRYSDRVGADTYYVLGGSTSCLPSGKTSTSTTIAKRQRLGSMGMQEALEGVQEGSADSGDTTDETDGSTDGDSGSDSSESDDGTGDTSDTPEDTGDGSDTWPEDTGDSGEEPPEETADTSVTSAPETGYTSDAPPVETGGHVTTPPTSDHHSSTAVVISPPPSPTPQHGSLPSSSIANPTLIVVGGGGGSGGATSTSNSKSTQASSTRLNKSLSSSTRSASSNRSSATVSSSVGDSSQDSNRGHTSRSNPAAIAGGVTAALLGLLAIVGAWLAHRRSRRRGIGRPPSTGEFVVDKDGDDLSSVATSAPPSHRRLRKSELESTTGTTAVGVAGTPTGSLQPLDASPIQPADMSPADPDAPKESPAGAPGTEAEGETEQTHHEDGGRISLPVGSKSVQSLLPPMYNPAWADDSDASSADTVVAGAPVVK